MQGVKEASWSGYTSELNYNVQTNLFSYNSNKLNYVNRIITK